MMVWMPTKSGLLVTATVEPRRNGLRDRAHADAIDAAMRRFQHLEAQTGQLNHFTGKRNMSGLFRHQAADGGRFIISDGGSATESSNSSSSWSSSKFPGTI